MDNAFHSARRIEFRDTDAAGIAHFTAFFAYMEEVEHELLRSLGLSVLWRDAAGPLSWPRVKATCEFTGAVRFEDVLDVEAHVARLGQKSVTYMFRFTSAGKPVAQGELVAVCCRVDPQHPPRSIEIPRVWREALSRYLSAPSA